MNCPACGRKMSVTENFAACTNILCDYEEEIEDWKIPVVTAMETQRIVID